MNNSSKVHQITRVAILVAIIFLLAFTPLGYLTIGPIAATTIQMPVIVGAVIMGPAAGAVLGFFFGLSAIIKVLTMPGADPFATLALAHSPLAYLAVCMGARILMGWLSGLLAAGLKKVPALDGGRSIIRYLLRRGPVRRRQPGDGHGLGGRHPGGHCLLRGGGGGVQGAGEGALSDEENARLNM